MPNNRGIMKDTNTLIDEFGGTAEVAKFLKLKMPSVSEWRTNNRIPPGPLMRLAAEMEKRGIVTRKELFPDDWQIIWPEMIDKVEA